MNELITNMIFGNAIKEVEQKDTQPIAKPVFKTENIALYVGDCLEIMKQFPDNCVDMIFADPLFSNLHK
jgi:site-specific DNA-methyltransferase (adenine-specific)